MRSDQRAGHALQRILLPTDFSSSAERAFPRALALSELFGAELHLLHIIPTLPDDEEARGKTADEKKARIELERFRMAYRYDLPSRGGADIVPGVVHSGNPGPAIADYTINKEIDLIVMGTRGWTPMNRLRLGSTTSEVLRLANCPVLTVPVHQQAAGLPQKILVLTYDTTTRARQPIYDGRFNGLLDRASNGTRGTAIEFLSLDERSADELLEEIIELDPELVVLPHRLQREEVSPAHQDLIDRIAGGAPCSVLALDEIDRPGSATSPIPTQPITRARSSKTND